ncbi:unnamed protein product [Rhizoctonia solani]|uniref:Uncharacterized protein n=1 Tax=Rhizoctonia solani TaxID=456999 RepID=A0A8H3DCS2_9AGAM|nr:unnamed protein product [Rhizoctonia solani]
MAIAFGVPVHPHSQLPNCLNSTLRCATEIMVVDLKLPPIPADLKHAGPFCTRAQEVRARDPIVCYWSLYYVAQLGVKRGKTPENQAFLAAVVDQLETMKRSLRNRRQITDETAGSFYVRQFGYNVFKAASNEDAHGQANRSTAKKFLAASYFLETLRVFGPLDTETEETIKYARTKANDIVRVLREGATPAPGAPPLAPNGYITSPSALSPQTNPVLLSGRPSNFASPADSPTAAGRKAFPFTQANYPPPPTEAGSGSPVSPRHVQPMFINPRRQAQLAQERQEIKPESVALPSSGSSGQIPLPEPASPRKLQSPVRERSPLAYLGPTAARNATKPSSPPPKPPTPVIKPPTPIIKPPSPKSLSLKPPSQPASPIKTPVPVPMTPPVIQLPEEWPASSIVLTRPPGPAEWPRHALVSPSMGSTMSVDSAETFTSSQLRTVIKSASTAPRATSPVKSESAASTEQQSDSEVTETEDETDDDESMAESTLMPVLTVVDDLAPKLEIPGPQAGGLVAVASPVVDDWGFGREMTDAIGKLTRAPGSSRALPLSASRASPISVSRASPLSASHASPLSIASETPIPASPDLEAGSNGITPAVVIPQSPAQPSPTTPNMRNYSPSTISPVSLHQPFKSAAEVIDFSFSKFDRGQEPELIDVEDEVGSGSSLSSFSSGSEDEAEAEDPKEDSDSSDGSSISDLTIQDEAKPQAPEEQKPTRKTVRFAPSVVGGLSPEVRKQILPPPLQPSRSQIVPTSAVPQPLVRPKSLTIRSNSYDSYQPSVRSPDSPMYGPSRASTLDGEFAIIPYHPSMSASHPAPAVQNNPAYAPTANNALVRTTWTSSPTQGPSVPPHRVQVDRETASLAQKYSRFAISSLNYMDIEAAKKELKAALVLLEGGDMY